MSNYKDYPPEDCDMSQEEWEELSYHGQYYHWNKDRKAYVRSRKNRRRKERRKIIDDYKKDKVCAWCGEKEYRILEFHHTSDNKKFSIANANNVGVSDERLYTEMEKCILICPNCHRKYHMGIETFI